MSQKQDKNKKHKTKRISLSRIVLAVLFVSDFHESLLRQHFNLVSK